MTEQPANTGRVHRWVGGLLLALWCVVCFIKVSQGRAVDLFWLSHVGLLLAGLALLVRSARLARVVLILVTVPHAFWLVDAMGMALTGASPMGITRYLASASAADWVATMHHFFLLPLLGLYLYRRPGWRSRDVADAWGLLVVLALLGRVAGDAVSNVNYSYGLLGGVDHPWLNALNGAHPTVFLCGLASVGLVGIALPGGLLCAGLCSKRGASAPTTPALAHAGSEGGVPGRSLG